MPQRRVTAYATTMTKQNNHTPTHAYDQLNRHSGDVSLTDNDFANDGYSLPFSPSSSAYAVPNSTDSYAYLSSTEGGIASTKLSLAGIYNSAASIGSSSIEGK